MRNRNGFSLIEIILTIMVMAVGVLAVLQAFNSVFVLDQEMSDRRIALILAQEKIEEIKSAASYAAIDGFASARADVGGDFAGFEREVLINGDPKEIKVNLYWGPDNEQTLQLVTLLADYNF